ncbi:hypothetical protein GQ600_2670 [Phytophthora cactorum]|nr:hypothetical protein GQ600_2670 [Phytophthora cactorum]
MYTYERRIRQTLSDELDNHYRHWLRSQLQQDWWKCEQESKDLETQELQEDLLSIVNVFIARRNGKKARILRQLRREQALKEGDPEQRDED